MDAILEKGLPCNLDAERMVLGAIVGIEGSFPQIAAALDAEDFALEKHRRIFAAAAAVHARGEHVDRVTIAHELQDRKQLEACDGPVYLCSLDDGLPTVFGVDAVVRRIDEKARARRAIVTLHGMIDRLTQGGDVPVDALTQTEQAVRDLMGDGRRDRRLRSTAEIITADGLNAFLQPHRRAPGIPLPWPNVNRMLTGMRPAQLIVVAARTSGGKTAAALQIAECAAEQGHGAAIFSLEMAAEDLLQRLVCSRAKVDSRAFRTGRTTDVDRFELQTAASELAELPLFIDDKAGCTVPALHASLRRHTGRHPIGLVVVDYLQLMDAVGRHDTRAQAVASISRGLKLLAREFGIPVIALSQLNREQARENRRPQFSDLKESSSIEQDADVVVFLHSTWTPGDHTEVMPVEFIVAKQRQGPIGKVDLAFHRRLVRFEEVAAGEQ